MILTDLHSIIYVPSPGDKFSELRFFHACLAPRFSTGPISFSGLLSWWRHSYAKLTSLAVQHLNNPTDYPLGSGQCMSFPSCYAFIGSIIIKNEDRVHCAFRRCCVKARPSPKLLEDVCGLNLAAHVNQAPSRFLVEKFQNLSVGSKDRCVNFASVQ